MPNHAVRVPAYVEPSNAAGAAQFRSQGVRGWRGSRKSDLGDRTLRAIRLSSQEIDSSYRLLAIG